MEMIAYNAMESIGIHTGVLFVRTWWLVVAFLLGKHWYTYPHELLTCSDFGDTRDTSHLVQVSIDKLDTAFVFTWQNNFLGEVKATELELPLAMSEH